MIWWKITAGQNVRLKWRKQQAERKEDMLREGIIFKQFISEPLIWFHNFVKVFSCYDKVLGLISHFIWALGSGKGSQWKWGRKRKWILWIYLFIYFKQEHRLFQTILDYQIHLMSERSHKQWSVLNILKESTKKKKNPIWTDDCGIKQPQGKRYSCMPNQCLINASQEKTNF